MTNLLAALFIVSIALNWFQFWKSRRIQREYTTDARELLHYLTTGGSVVKIEVLDPSKLLLYRG